MYIPTFETLRGCNPLPFLNGTLCLFSSTFESNVMLISHSLPQCMLAVPAILVKMVVLVLVLLIDMSVYVYQHMVVSIVR